MATKADVLNQVAVFNTEISIWSARRKLRESDFNGVGREQLPPQDIASLGSKKVFDPKRLNIFEKLKRQADRECSLVGTRFMSGYAVPIDKIETLADTLDTLERRFNDAVDALIRDYDVVLEQWIAKNGEWGRIIRAAAYSKAEVKPKFRFDYQVYFVNEVDNAKVRHRLASAASNLGNTLFQEVAAVAADLLKRSLHQDTASRKALRPVVRIREKLDSMSFLDDRIQGIVAQIDAVIGSMPKIGKIEGPHLASLISLVQMLSNLDVDPQAQVQPAQIAASAPASPAPVVPIQAPAVPAPVAAEPPAPASEPTADDTENETEDDMISVSLVF